MKIPMRSYSVYVTTRIQNVIFLDLGSAHSFPTCITLIGRCIITKLGSFEAFNRMLSLKNE